MYVVTWNDEDLTIYEEHFETINEALDFIEYLEDDGIYNAKLFKGSFNK